MKLQFYLLGKDNVPIKIDRELTHHELYWKILKTTKLEQYTVSSIFSGIDCGQLDGPFLFETMVFHKTKEPLGPFKWTTYQETIEHHRTAAREIICMLRKQKLKTPFHAGDVFSLMPYLTNLCINTVEKEGHTDTFAKFDESTKPVYLGSFKTEGRK